MPAIILIILALLVGGITSARIRKVIYDGLAGVEDYVIGGWPTWAEAKAAARRVWKPLFIVLGVSWATFFILIFLWGFAINAPWSGFFIGLLFLVWWALFMLRPFRVAKIPYWITTIILLVAIPNFLVGVWSPEYKAELNRRSENRKGEMANEQGKGSKKSEPESGIFARIMEETTLLNAAGEPIEIVAAGTVVRVLSLQKNTIAEESEGATRVMLADKYGWYKDGLSGYVPSRVLNWNWKGRFRIRKVVLPAPAPPPPPPPPPPRQLAPKPEPQPPPQPKIRTPFWELTVFGTGVTRINPRGKPAHYGADVEFPDQNRIRIRQRFGKMTIFEGVRTENKEAEEYEGIWHSRFVSTTTGKFYLCFESKTLATGWFSTRSGEKFPIRLERLVPEYND